MKKFAVLSVLLCFFGSAFAMGKAPASAVGHLNFYGSAPNVFPGFVTIDGLEYAIEAEENPEATIKEICSHQGELLELTGEILKPDAMRLHSLKNGIFVVSEWKVIK